MRSRILTEPKLETRSRKEGGHRGGEFKDHGEKEPQRRGASEGPRTKTE